jgi:hypothetical protein
MGATLEQAKSARATPEVAKSASVRARDTPEVVKSASVRVRATLEEAESASVRARATPEEVKSTSVRARATPEEAKSASVRARDTPEVVKSASVRVRATPEVVKSVSASENTKWCNEVRAIFWFTSRVAFGFALHFERFTWLGKASSWKLHGLRFIAWRFGFWGTVAFTKRDVSIFVPLRGSLDRDRDHIRIAVLFYKFFLLNVAAGTKQHTN